VLKVGRHRRGRTVLTRFAACVHGGRSPRVRRQSTVASAGDWSKSNITKKPWRGGEDEAVTEVEGTEHKRGERVSKKRGVEGPSQRGEENPQNGRARMSPNAPPLGEGGATLTRTRRPCGGPCVGRLDG